MSNPIAVIHEALMTPGMDAWEEEREPDAAALEALADVEVLVQAAQRVAASSAYLGIGEAPWTVDPDAAVELHTALRPFSSEESDSDKETV